MAKRFYTIYCDESAKKGPFYSNFYGGALLASEDRQAIEDALRAKKAELNLHAELKWTKITKNYEQKYIDFIRTYFDFIRSGRIKMRIMFTHNYRRPVGLTEEQKSNQYFILYYQMVKHSFGLVHCNPNNIDRVFISMLLDEIPDTREKLEKFRRFIENIEHTATFRGKQVYFQRGQIGNVDSKNHAILQGLDIILGSMDFRLNDYHKAMPEGQTRRGKRTIAKEKVYKEINRQIRSIYANFNIGSTTGLGGSDANRWNHRYRHWCFTTAEYEVDPDAVKPR